MAVGQRGGGVRRAWSGARGVVREGIVEALEARLLLHGGHEHGAAASDPAVAWAEDLKARSDLAGPVAKPDEKLLAAGAGGGSEGIGAAAQRLPDLVPWADAAEGYVYGWSFDTSSQPGRKLLRLTTAIANLGQGPMELRGSTANGDGTQDVLQRIYNTDGSFTDRLAGKFTYHPSHGHIHFDGFAAFILRERPGGSGVGEVAAAGGKQSFCLLDVDRHPSSPAGTPASSVYASCSAVRQGISVGWADVYSSSLDGQTIDITGVPYGQYWIEVVADPDGHIDEADETNNVVRVAFDYVAPPPDDVGNTAAEATAFGAFPGTRSATLAPAHDEDFFSFEAEAGQTYAIETVSPGTLADTAIALLDPTGTVVLDADDDSGAGALSKLVWTAPADGTYFVKVSGDGTGTGTYTLSIAPGEPDDHGNTAASATPLGPPPAQASGTIATEGDRDFFAVEAAAGTRWIFETLSGGTLSDTVLTLYGPDGATQIDSDDDGGEGALSRLAWLAPADGTYYVRVTPYGTGTGSYTLRATTFVPEPDDHGDAAASATAVGAIPATVGGSIGDFGDGDVFSFAAEGGQTYELATVSPGTLTDTTLTLYAADGVTELAFDDNGGGAGGLSKIVWTAPAGGGTFYVRVAAAQGTAMGTYTLSVAIGTPPPPDDHGDAWPTATPATVPSDRPGTISSASDVDYFSFSASAAGAGYVLETIAGGGTLGDTTLTLYGPDGTTPLAFDDDGGAGTLSRLTWTAPAAGTYYVKVAGYSGATGTYTLRLSAQAPPPPDDHANSSVGATPLAWGQAAAGVIGSATDVDVFSFTAIAGARYLITTTLGTLQDSVVRLLASNGSTEVAWNDDGAGGLASRIDWTAPASGTYYVEVRGYGEDDVGSYALNLLGGAGVVPQPWLSAGVGVKGIAGGAGIHAGTYTVQGTGADIGGTADGFQFLYRPQTGDFELVARLAFAQAYPATAEAGIMVREGLTADARAVSLVLTAGGGALSFQARSVTSGTTAVTSAGSTSAPVWLKLVRLGGTLMAYRSLDGAAWTLAGQANVAMGATVLAGLAVSSHDQAMMAAARFDQVSVTRAIPAAVTGSAGADVFRLRRSPDGASVELYVNAAAAGQPPTYVSPAGSFGGLTIHAGAGDDVLEVDYAHGDPLGDGGVDFDGGEGTDRLTVAHVAAGATVEATAARVGLASAPAERAVRPGSVETIRLEEGTFQVGALPAGAAVEAMDGAQVALVMPAALGSLAVRGTGSAALGAGTPRVLKVGSLAMDAATATLDLGQGALIVSGGGPAALATVIGLIASARAAAGTWEGPGITSAAAGDGMGLAAALNGDDDGGGGAEGSARGTFFGQEVGPADVLVRFSPDGDADLDGRLTAADYFRIDRGRALGLTGYAAGDFDHDGTAATADDYLLIDAAFVRQGAGATAVTPPQPPAGTFSIRPVVGQVQHGANEEEDEELPVWA